MAKLMGAVLLTGGGLWLGLGWSGELRRRMAALEGWLAALSLLRGELSVAVPSTPTLLEELSRRAPAPAGAVFAQALRGLDKLGERAFSEIWVLALSDCPVGLDGEDIATLSLLGHVLGRCGREEQFSALRRVEEELERRLASLREELARKGKAYGATGLALGLFLTILLL